MLAELGRRELFVERYDVILTAIDDGADVNQAVQTVGVVFGLDLVDAWRAVETLPAKILEDVDERSAEELLIPLRRAGWRVRLLARPRASRLSSRPEALRPAVPTTSSTPAPSTPSAPASSASPAGETAASPWTVPPSLDAPDASGGVDLSAPRLPSLDGPGAAAAPAWDEPGHDLELDIEALQRASSRPSRLVEVAPAALADLPLPALDDPSTEPSFFASLPRTLLIAFRGGAGAWFVRSVTLSIGILILAVFASMLVLVRLPTAVMAGLAVLLIGGAFWFGHLLAWFRACLWAGITGEPGPDRPPEVGSLDELLDGFFTGLMVIVLVGVVNLGLLVTMGLQLTELAPTPELALRVIGRVMIADVVLFAHMPIGLALIALRRNRWSYFDLFSAFRMVLFAPLELFAIYALFVIAALATQTGLGWISQIPMPWYGQVVAVGAAMISATLFQYGLMGAAFGAMIRAKPGLVR